MRKAETIGGLVVNLIEVDPANIPEWAADWPDAGDHPIGSMYDGQGFADPAKGAAKALPSNHAILDAITVIIDGDMGKARKAMGK